MMKKEQLYRNIRFVTIDDAKQLSDLRIQVDAETMFLDREPGEGVLSEADFVDRITEDINERNNVCYVAEVEDEIVGYVRCATNGLKRFEHQVSLGICIKKAFWGHGIGKSLMNAAIKYCDNVGVEKIGLIVVESNKKAVEIYKKMGFEIEGKLIKDRKYIDGTYDDTILMARFGNE